MGIERLELLEERRARLKAQLKCRELQNALDSVDLRVTDMERSYELVRIAFHAGIPMDQIKNMIVTSDGVMMKGKNNA